MQRNLNETKTVKVKRLTETAKLPTFAKPGDAGADLYWDEGSDYLMTHTIEPGERFLADTGIAIELPEGYEAQVRSRSGLALKHGLMVLNSPGTIDSGFRGQIKVILLNTSNKPVEITNGERIAQLVVAPVQPVSYLEVEELSDTERGEGGFGSTGK